MGNLVQFKPGVKLGGLQPEMALAALVIETTMRDYGAVVITSACDGEHSDGSLHYKGRALDFRSQHLAPHHKDIVFKALRHNLGAEFDVLLEDRAGENEHFHVEYDPKE